MKTVNVRLFALKHKLIEKLTKSLNADKDAIKNGAKLTMEKFAKIQIVDCTRTTLDKSKVQELATKYGIDMATLEKTTDYKRIDIDNIATDIDDKVNDILETLENSNDKVISKAASKVANKVQ